MKTLLIAFLLFSANLFAQNSFRIFDMQNNDVTGGIFSVTDTSTQNVQVQFNVENIDSVTYSVTAGRLVISAPPGSANAITWNLTNYAPTVDSSVVNPQMAPQNILLFVGDYFPNGNLGVATINYCFWDRADMTNNSCVTVTFNIILSVITPETNYQVNLFPNPVATEQNLTMNWDKIPGEMLFVKLISVNGTASSFAVPAANGKCEIPLAGINSGMYIVEIATENSILSRNKLVIQ